MDEAIGPIGSNTFIDVYEFRRQRSLAAVGYSIYSTNGVERELIVTSSLYYNRNNGRHARMASYLADVCMAERSGVNDGDHVQ